MTLAKFQLRKEYIAKRAAIKPAAGEAAGKAAAAILAKQSLFKRSLHIACYLPFKDEFDATPLIEAIWEAKKQCYIPVLPPADPHDKSAQRLQFVLYEYGDALHFNRFGILEPVRIEPVFPPEQLDLVLAPLVAFDLQGHRLGTGGGYYDRTFDFLGSGEIKTPVMWGVAYDAQEAEALPSDPWDILLSGIITESRFTPTPVRPE